ncbi:MAG: ornithine cyclodeaminase family protein [Pyrinomonadaceae bacterium]|nr:ornithine cyclodeaminase family protein [Pyrinomonadaceae bacterium]
MDEKDQTLVLSSGDVQTIVLHVGLDRLTDDLIERLDLAIKLFDPKSTSIPVRTGFHYEKPEAGLIEWMPLYNQGEKAVVKIVGYHPANPGIHDFPTVVSTISAYDTSTGHLSAIMDGVLTTALRTGAMSAVASGYLAYQESSTLGLIGCGAQAISQIHALSRRFKLKSALIYDTDLTAMESFSTRCELLDLEIDIRLADLEAIAGKSDILCTATSIDVGAGPVFSDLETLDHLHVNAVGSDFPGKIEIPVDLLQRSFVCPDFLGQALIEGECQQLRSEDIDEDLISVAQNPERFVEVRSRSSVFDSTGWALEDQVVMDLFLEYATELGLGQKLEIEHIPLDVKNPFDFLETPPIRIGQSDDVQQLELNRNFNK